MDAFVWKPAYSVNDERIDKQHKKLVSLVGELNAAMGAGKGKAVLGRILSDLVTYVAEHFRDEEAIMRQQDYPELLKHIALHAELTSTAMKLKREFDAGSIALTIATLTFLQSWLNDHILGADHAFARYVSQKKQQRVPVGV